MTLVQLFPRFIWAKNEYFSSKYSKCPPVTDFLTIFKGLAFFRVNPFFRRRLPSKRTSNGKKGGDSRLAIVKFEKK